MKTMVCCVERHALHDRPMALDVSKRSKIQQELKTQRATLGYFARQFRLRRTRRQYLFVRSNEVFICAVVHERKIYFRAFRLIMIRPPHPPLVVLFRFLVPFVAEGIRKKFLHCAFNCFCDCAHFHKWVMAKIHHLVGHLSEIGCPREVGCCPSRQKSTHDVKRPRIHRFPVIFRTPLFFVRMPPHDVFLYNRQSAQVEHPKCFEETRSRISFGRIEEFLRSKINIAR